MFVVPYTRSAAITSRAPSLASVVDRFFDESFDRFIDSTRALAETRTPTMDVVEGDAAFTVVLDVPGATRDQLKVAVEGRRVSVSSVRGSDGSKGEPQADAAGARPAEATSERVIYRERATVAYARTVVLPVEVDAAASRARFENGVLTLTLPKKVKAGATEIEIA
jgi:HSP20 family protein